MTPTPKRPPFEFDENPPYPTVQQIVGFMPMTEEMHADFTATQEAVSAAIDRQFDLMLNPWKRPHHNPFPDLDPVPWFSKWQQRTSEARERIVGAVNVLRHGVIEPEDEW